MRIAQALLMIVALLFSPLFLEKAGAETLSGPHHEHPESREASPNALGHEHGDYDDHHSSPDSPCHHHELHCCCSHAHNVLPTNLTSLGNPTASRRIRIHSLQPHIPPTLKSLLHVPIA